MHKLRKEREKRDCTVYGVACDAVYFHFLKINDNSEVDAFLSPLFESNHSNVDQWSERQVKVCQPEGYTEAFGLLVFLMRRALALSPTSLQSSMLHSKDSSAQTHSRRGSAESNISFDTASPNHE